MEEVSVSWFQPRAVLVRAAVAGAGLAVTLPLLACLGYAQTLGAGTGVCALATMVLWVPSALMLVPLLLNRTTVRLHADRIEVRHGPIPWAPNPELVRGEVLSFEVMPSGTSMVVIPVMELVQHRSWTGRRHVHSRMSSEAIDAGGGWSVEALLVDGSLEPIASGIRDRADAVGLAEKLTAWLGRGPAPDPNDLSLFSPNA